MARSLACGTRGIEHREDQEEVEIVMVCDRASKIVNTVTLISTHIHLHNMNATSHIISSCGKGNLDVRTTAGKAK